MKKFRLEDIDRKRVLTEPPEGYFDKLPGIIQSKTAHKTGRSRVNLFLLRGLKMVPVAALLVLIAVYTGVISFQDNNHDFEQILAEVTTEEIILYLEDMDVSSDEILEEIDLNALSMELDNPDDVLMESLDIEDEALLQLYEDYQVQDSLL